ncbi:hypothetical protein KY349_02460 [Candidatus Woesearchaeota archaeon]|jgi:hypothetical protein|nr:hypothetical protein [Candidatus Woesearchaeota archaeon]
MIWRIRNLKDRVVRYLRRKRFVLHAEILSLLNDLQQWRERKPKSRLRIRIIKVCEKRLVKVK